jgi:hypothetical protein
VPNAPLSNDVLSDLVADIDEIRDDAFDCFGTRPYRVWLERRQWDGGRLGLGNLTKLSETEIVPRPLLMRWLDGRLVPSGLDETGRLVLTEVSLTFSEDELYPKDVDVDAGEEFVYRIEDGQGQGLSPRYFVVRRPPMPDRRKRMGWEVELEHYETEAAA